MTKRVLTPAEVEAVRELLGVAGELLAMARHRRSAAAGEQWRSGRSVPRVYRVDSGCDAALRALARTQRRRLGDCLNEALAAYLEAHSQELAKE